MQVGALLLLLAPIIPLMFQHACSTFGYVFRELKLLLLLLLLLKIFKEGWLFSCRCFSRGPPFKYIIQLKRNKISIKNLITTATEVSEELYTIMKIKKQVIKVGC